MSKNPNLLKPSLLSASVSAALGAMVLSSIAPVAYAADEAAQLEEIVITGSRIVRRDYQSNSPIVTVDAGDFETQTGLNVESYLNQLPEYNPASSPTTSQGDVQITPVNSVGIASISLRGFGANRSLVLVNGKRPVPINALMVTDVNGVPSALVQRVETITGGASAVYGADAIGGVTNFILREDFEGFETDVQYGIQDANDGDEYRVSAVMGANFADGRGNVTMGMEQYSREEALQRNRDFYRDFWAAPDTAGSFLFLQGVNNGGFIPPNNPSAAAVQALYGGVDPRSFGGRSNPNIAAFNFNPDGSIWLGGNAFSEGRARIPVDGMSYAYQNVLNNQEQTPTSVVQTLKWNNTQALASAPQERWSFFASGNFDVTDRVRAFTRANFAESRTETLLFGTNAIGGWEAFIPYDPNVDSPIDPTLNYADPAVLAAIMANPNGFANPNFIPTGAPGAHFPVPREFAMMLNSRTQPDGPWQPGWNPDFSLPPRSTINTNEVWQIEAGIDFDLGFRDWTGELYYSHGESATYNNAAGNLSLARFRTVINYPDYGRNAAGTGNMFYVVGTNPDNAQIVTTVRPTFGAGDFTCQTGFYDTLFGGDQPLSEDCFNAVNATLQTRASNQQDIIELNFQGSVMELPAGELRAAVGYQKRDNEAQFVPDILQSQDSFTDQVVGVYPTGYLDASTSVDDYYAEALVPILSDLPFIQMLELELGVRYSDYSETDEETTWKALGNWQVNDWIRLRGGFNRATRAPNLGELFLNQQEVFTGAGSFGDPCSVRANAPYGAGGTTFASDPVITGTETAPVVAAGQTQAGANSTFLICQALMGGPGSFAEQQFYFTGQDVAAQTGGGGFAWVLQKGNRTLTSETADSWTFGGVINSPWDNAWLSGLTLTLDWYNVEIEDAIMLNSVTQSAYNCFGTRIVTNAQEAAEQARTAACELVPRDQRNGAALNSMISYTNQATIETSGLDVGVNWFGDLNELFGLPGGLALGLNATILDKYETKQSPAPFDVVTEWKGSLGPNLSGTNGGAYDFRLFGNISYSLNDWSVSLRWRHLPEVHSATYASQKAIIENNARVSAGGEGIILSYAPWGNGGVLNEIATDSYNIFDLAMNWNINETLALRGGVTNLFDEEPPTTGDNRGLSPAGGPSSLQVCNGAPGCQNPFGYSLPSRGAFNGGYYDTLGRRYFLGLKATF